MSTVLEVAGLSVLAVGVFMVLGVPFGLIVVGLAVFLYAQTVSDSAVVAAYRRWRAKPPAPAAKPEKPAQPPMTRNVAHVPPPWPKDANGNPVPTIRPTPNTVRHA